MKSEVKRGYLLEDFRLFRLKTAMSGEIEPHYHDFHKVLLFEGGDAGYIIEGRKFNLTPGDIVLVSAGDVHCPVVAAGKPYERTVIYISPQFLKHFSGITDNTDNLQHCFDIAKNKGSVLHINGRVRPFLLSPLETVISETDNYNNNKNAFAGRLMAKAAFIQFVIALNRAIIYHDLREERAKTDPKIEKLIAHINANLQDADLTADALAKNAFLSRWHLMRKFKAVTGYSLHRYITEKRLLKARQLLTDSDAPITEVCYMCGFNDYSTFARAFKKLFNRSPKNMR